MLKLDTVLTRLVNNCSIVQAKLDGECWILATLGLYSDLLWKSVDLDLATDPVDSD